MHTLYGGRGKCGHGLFHSLLNEIKKSTFNSFKFIFWGFVQFFMNNINFKKIFNKIS